MNVAGTIFTIVFAMPLFIAVILPLAVVYYFVQKIYVATARQVQQLQVKRATNGCFQQFFNINIARIANAVQVTICLLVSTSVY